MNEGEFLILIPGNEPGAPLRWQRIAGERIVAEGDDAAALTNADKRVVMIVPSHDATINWAELPGLTLAQARAAARLLAAENSISPIETLHIAVGEERDGSSDRPIATVARHRMDAWLGAARATGFEPELILPAAMLLPRPEVGFVSGMVFGQKILVGRDSAFADEDALSAAIVGDAVPVALSEQEVAQSLAARLESPPINLRQGDYGVSRKWKADARMTRRVLILIAAIALASLAIGIAQIARYNIAAGKLERETGELARDAVPDAASNAGAIATIGDRLSAMRGGGAGFAASTAAVFATVRTVPNAELTTYDFGIDGTIRIGVTTATAEDQAAFITRLQQYGFSGQGSAPQQAAGRFAAEYVVRAR